MRSNERESIRSVFANFPVIRRSAYEGTTESGGLCNLSKPVSHHDPGLGDPSNNVVFRLRDAVAVHCSGRVCALAEHAAQDRRNPPHLIPPLNLRLHAWACLFIAPAESRRMGHSADRRVLFLPWAKVSIDSKSNT